MEDTSDAGKQQFPPCRVELLSPETDWSNVWRLCRLKGLPGDLASFTFKLVHQLLITRKGLQRIGQATSNKCDLCSDNVVDDLEHSLTQCSFNEGVGVMTVQTVRFYEPAITPTTLLRLECNNMSEDHELPVVIFSSAILQYIWDWRRTNKRPQLYEIRSGLEARCRLLRETSFQNEANHLYDMINLL